MITMITSCAKMGLRVGLDVGLDVGLGVGGCESEYIACRMSVGWCRWVGWFSSGFEVDPFGGWVA